MFELLEELKKDVPEFEKFEEFDEFLFTDYGRLGSYLEGLLIISNESAENSILKEQTQAIIEKIFSHLNAIYVEGDKEISNLISVSIFEVLITLEEGYKLAKQFFSGKLLIWFLKEFPENQHGSQWNTKEMYSKDDMDELLKSLKA